MLNAGCRQRAAAQPAVDLAQAEQLEMIDQEGAEQHQRPAEPEDRLQDDTRRPGW